MVKYIRNYYKILRINKNADKKTIRKAYKRATLKYHPDINKNPKAIKRFQLIQEAYTVLSDDAKREKYDKILEKTEKKDNKINIDNTINFIKDIEDNYGILSKGTNMLFNSFKSQPLLTGSKLLLGGAATGIGIKKGRNYINKRRGKN